MGKWRRKESRTIPEKGSTTPAARDRGNGLDYQQWFRCWNCGWINKLGVDALGGDSSPSGIYPIDYQTKEAPGDQASDVRNTLPIQCSLDSFNLVGVIQQVGPDNLPISVRHDYLATVSMGCKLCGSLNWKGEI